jgi:hypothetical protein
MIGRSLLVPNASSMNFSRFSKSDRIASRICSARYPGFLLRSFVDAAIHAVISGVCFQGIGTPSPSDIPILTTGGAWSRGDGVRTCGTDRISSGGIGRAFLRTEGNRLPFWSSRGRLFASMLRDDMYGLIPRVPLNGAAEDIMISEAARCNRGAEKNRSRLSPP